MKINDRFSSFISILLEKFVFVFSFSSIDYMQYLIKEKKKQEDDLESLRKEVLALNIMKA